MKEHFHIFFLLIFSSFFLCAYEDRQPFEHIKMPADALTFSKRQNTKSQKLKRRGNRNKYHKYKYLINTWEPYWVSINELEEPRFIFYQMNIGVGFLYFSHVRGNLGGNPSRFFPDNGSVPYQGRTTYNRTPLFEYLLGYKFKSFLRAAISYQHQSAVTVQTKAISPIPGTAPANVRGAQSMLRSYFSVDAFMLKGYVDFPWPMIWKMMAYSPYIGAGFGVGWQSWTNNVLTLQSLNNGYSSSQLFLTSKYSANCIWGLDAGIKIQSAKPGMNFALFAGVKYNQWGQTRNIGKMRSQGASKLGLAKPFRIRTVYSFAPYLSLQWDIQGSSFAPPPNRIDGKSVDTWKGFIVNSNQLQTPQATFVNFNGGIGFLYFAGVKGDLSLIPPDGAENIGQFPGKYKFNYNRSPVVEYLFGYRLSPWVKVAISKQSQANIFVQTKTRANINGAIPATARFQGNLNLLSAAAKVFVELPKALIWKNMAYNLYVSGGVGPSWQTWTRMGVGILNTQNVAFSGRDRATGDFFPLRPKIIPNVFVMADAGLKIKNATPKMNFYLVAGCRYNFWGSTRNLGKITQQYPTFREGLFKPLTIKTLYSFVPYLGVQWNFDSVYKYNPRRPLIIKGRDVHTWRPFFAFIPDLEKDKPIFAQVNTGVGFLYFERVRTNLAGEPSNNAMDIFGESPFEDTPCYNRTPLFEYLIGTRIFDWWNMVISYQYQSGVAISTGVLPAVNANPGASGFVAKGNRFVSNFRVDSIMAKFYFNLPISIIWVGFVNTPYIAPGVGVGWQSWTRADIERLGNIPAQSLNAQMDQPINQRISANIVWTIDIGIRSSFAVEHPGFSSTMGIKYIDWGQAYSMGKKGDQRGSSLSLFKPFRVRMVYSFAPYFGVQWNF